MRGKGCKISHRKTHPCSTCLQIPHFLWSAPDIPMFFETLFCPIFSLHNHDRWDRSHYRESQRVRRLTLLDGNLIESSPGSQTPFEIPRNGGFLGIFQELLLLCRNKSKKRCELHQYRFVESIPSTWILKRALVRLAFRDATFFSCSIYSAMFESAAVIIRNITKWM